MNDFLGGLWHDLPEVLTRDIISPIKRSIEGLDELIKEIEQRKMEDVLLPLLPLSWQDDILNFTMDEFRNKIRLEGRVQGTGGGHSRNHQDGFSPVGGGGAYNQDGIRPGGQGEMLKGCDHLAAFLEAWLSIQCGITSHHLAGVVEELPRQYAHKVVGGVDFGAIYEQFRA